MIEEMIEKLPEIVVGGFLGGFGKFLWDRYFSDRAISTQQLLEKKVLTRHGRRRLKQEAYDTLSRLRTIWKPPETGIKLDSWPAQNEAIFVRSCDSLYGDTACPCGEIESLFTPLFISLKSSESKDALVHELNKEFESFLPDEDISKRLLQRGFNSKVKPKIWIMALGIEVKSRAEMFDLLTELSEIARKWIFNPSIVLEIYLSYDIFYDEFIAHGKDESLIINTKDFMPNWKTKDQDTPSHSSYALHYVFERSKAVNYLNNGEMLGSLSVPQEYRIPIDILESRYFQYFNQYDLDPTKWPNIAISGPPGSGKTELANVLANKLVSDYKMIVLVLSTPQQLAKLEEISKNSHKHGFEELVDTPLIQNTSNVSDINNSLYSGLSEVDRAKKDAIQKKIKDRSCPLLIIVDDLHSRRDARDSLFRLCDKRWDFNFILIGRTKFTEYENFPDIEKNIYVECQLWNKEQSKKIILNWLPESQKVSELRFFEEWWPSHLKYCSLYLLREIINSTENLKRTPSTLIRTAIEHHISSIKEVIGTPQKPTVLLLEEIQNLLQNKVSSEEILEKLENKSEAKVDVILLLGLLSWYSRYELQDNTLDPDKVVIWSRGIIASKEEAYRFLKKGEEAKIFSLFRTEAAWRNKLVAEGCAALYIDYEIDRCQSSSTIANMVELLDKAGSIDILNLVLDTDQIKKIIASVSCAKSASACVIDRLLNEEFISKIEDDKKWIEKLGFALIEQSNRANISQIEPFARAFSRLMLLISKRINESNQRNSVLESWCLQHVASGDISKSKFALSSLAAYHQNDNLFFEKAKIHDADPLLSLEMAVRLWSEESEVFLRSKLIDLSNNGYDDNKVKYIWSCWCNQQSSNKILENISQLISELDRDKVYEKSYTLLISSSFEVLFHNKPKIHLLAIEKIKSDISRLACDGKRAAANEIVKWVFFYYFPNLSNLQFEWMVDLKGQYALPQRSYSPLKLREIFARVASAYPSVDLPHSRELRTVENFTEGERELVRDKFLKGYISGETKITPAAISTWDGKNIGYLSKDEIESSAIFWRPLYRF